MSNFGERLKAKRKEAGLSQAAFAELMGVHRRSQINYESGKRQPTLEYLMALENAGFDVPLLVWNSNEAVLNIRSAAHFHLLSKVTVLLGMSSEGLSRGLDQAYEIMLSAIQVKGDQVLLNDKRVDKEMTILAIKLLHEEGIKEFS